MNVLIIGGGQRNVHLQTALTQAGYTVTDFALGGKAEHPDYRRFRGIVGPIPFNDDSRHLQGPLHMEEITIADFLDSLPGTATLFAGTIPSAFAIHCRILFSYTSLRAAFLINATVRSKFGRHNSSMRRDTGSGISRALILAAGASR